MFIKLTPDTGEGSIYINIDHIVSYSKSDQPNCRARSMLDISSFESDEAYFVLESVEQITSLIKESALAYSILSYREEN